MKKLIVFDLDGTLAAVGKGMLPGHVQLLRQLEARGARIAVCSGKPTYYLCGFMRQVGLQAPVLVGENGAVIQFGVDLPPGRYEVLPYSRQAAETVRFLREKLDEVLPRMWYQPNQVGLTPFPARPEEFEVIEQILRDNAERIRDVTVYRHFDTFDIIPNGITKGEGLRRLGQLLNIPPEDTVAVGDGINDYPMFDYAGHSVGIGVEEEGRVDRNFPDIGSALNYILTLTGT